MPESRPGGGLSSAAAGQPSDPGNESKRDTAPDPLIGRVIGGRFKVLSVIARGGMGKVYRAEQAPLGRLCALKVLSPKYDGERDPEFHRRFLLEASTAAKLTHQNTVTIFDYGQEPAEELYYIAMEYIEGRTLHRVLRDEAPLAEHRVAHIAAQICRSLREAHQLGVVHRDLKPGNVLISQKADEHDVVKVVDFGLVKDVTGEAEDLTQAGLFMGSPKYMAPEQILGTEISPRTDIYSLGVMIYEMLCGKVPFDRGASVGTLMAHVNEPPPPMQANNPSINISAGMEAIVRKCLEKDPNARFVSMKALLDALKRVGAGIVDTNEGMPAAYAGTGRTSAPPDSLVGPSSISQRGALNVVSPSGPPSFTGSSGNHPAPVFASPSMTEVAGADRTAVVDLQPKKQRAWLWAVLVGLVGVGVFAGVHFTRAPAPGSADASGAPSASTSATQATVAPTPPPSAPPSTTTSAPAAPTAQSVHVESMPPGAAVLEGNELLCKTTPCDVVFKGDKAKASHTLKFVRTGMKEARVEVAVGQTETTAKLEPMGGGGAPRGNGPAPKGTADYKPSPY